MAEVDIDCVDIADIRDTASVTMTGAGYLPAYVIDPAVPPRTATIRLTGNEVTEITAPVSIWETPPQDHPDSGFDPPITHGMVEIWMASEGERLSVRVISFHGDRA